MTPYGSGIQSQCQRWLSWRAGEERTHIYWAWYIHHHFQMFSTRLRTWVQLWLRGIPLLVGATSLGAAVFIIEWGPTMTGSVDSLDSCKIQVRGTLEIKESISFCWTDRETETWNRGQGRERRRTQPPTVVNKTAECEMWNSANL